MDGRASRTSIRSLSPARRRPGKIVAATAAQTLKRVTLELGGKSPSVVFDDADLDAAVAGALYGVYYNAGQCCEARSRILVQSGIYDRFVEQLRRKSEAIARRRSRRSADADRRDHAARTVRKDQSLLRDRRRRGRESAVRWNVRRRSATRLRAERSGVRPPSRRRALHRIAREEIFGPVATFVRFDDEAEAIALANASEYGLAASVWSTNVGRANRVARAIRSGSVAINTPYAVFPGVPFGGYKQSGYGRELGMETMRLYTETKSVLTYIGEKAMDPFGVNS